MPNLAFAWPFVGDADHDVEGLQFVVDAQVTKRRIGTSMKCIELSPDEFEGGMQFGFYRLRMTKMIKQTTTIVPIIPYPNIVASSEH